MSSFKAKQDKNVEVTKIRMFCSMVMCSFPSFLSVALHPIDVKCTQSREQVIPSVEN